MSLRPERASAAQPCWFCFAANSGGLRACALASIHTGFCIVARVRKCRESRVTSRVTWPRDLGATREPSRAGGLSENTRVNQTYGHVAHVPCRKAVIFALRKNGRVALQRMDNVGIVVESLDAAVSFFAELGLELDGRATIEGEWAGRVTGLSDQRVEIAMMRTPDGHSRLELSRFFTPPVVADHRNAR